MRIFNVVGARPNFMKIAPIHRRMQNTHSALDPILVHTGQHYDERMSKFFFDDLQLPKPDVYLGVGSGSHAEQTAKIMVEFEKICQEQKPDLVLVVGDVNSTMACSIVASKLWIPVAHVEAGLRSFDRHMPEEINRLVTDALADHLFVTEKSGEENLLREGAHPDKIHFTGNVMIDSLIGFMEKARQMDTLSRFGLVKEEFVLVTLHRPSNVDDPRILPRLLNALQTIQERITVVFPIHPRARKNLESFCLMNQVDHLPNLKLVPPLGYLDFINLEMNCRFVITDSGGLQEETTYLGKPCLTVRENTERPITAELGTNEIVGTDTDKLIALTDKILNGQWKKGQIPPLWDGKASERIVQTLESLQE